MPISKLALAALLCLGLAGCVAGLGGGAGAARDISVTSDAVRIVGPSGFCVDPGATRDDGETAFVLMGNCAAIAETRRAAQPDLRAVLTAAVSARGDGGEISGNLGGLDAFFRSAPGRRLLSRDGDEETVTILESAVAGEIFYLHARDTSEATLSGVQDTYWRAYMDVGPRIATLTVLGLRGDTPSDAAHLETLQRFAQAVQAANIGSGASAAVPAVDQTATETPVQDNALFNFRIFRRILR